MRWVGAVVIAAVWGFCVFALLSARLDPLLWVAPGGLALVGVLMLGIYVYAERKGPRRG